jgi:hypothetical protein
MVKGYEALMPRLRAIQWMLLLDLAMVARERWTRLDVSERRRLTEIARNARHMSKRDRADLRRIVSKLELVDAGRDLMPLIRSRGKPRRH